jgi:peptidoglycan hydrolase-like protein with peptidoglycan-binding domain
MGAGEGEFAKDAYYVKSLQDALVDQGYQVPADGVFDKEIESAVKDFQKKRGLKYQDGIVGEETMKALNIGKFREKSWYDNDLFDPIREAIESFYASN